MFSKSRVLMILGECADQVSAWQHHTRSRQRDKAPLADPGLTEIRHVPTKRCEINDLFSLVSAGAVVRSLRIPRALDSKVPFMATLERLRALCCDV
jgi:hypothetical protein